MAYGAGIGASLGIATESTFNTYVAPDHFVEFTSESINYTKNAVVSNGLRAGGVLPRIQRRVVTTTGASGALNIDLASRGIGLLLAHCMGSFPSKVGGGFTFTLGDPSTKSFTAQVGVPKFDGTIDPKTITGAKVTDWTLAVPNAGLATLSINVDAAGFTRSTGLATPSYSTAGSVFQFAGAAIKVGGSTVAYVSDFNLTVSNSLKTDRYTIGNAGLKREQIVNGFRAVSGTLNAEFIDTTAYAAILADTTSSLQLTLTSGSEVLDITLPAIKFEGDAPQVGGPETIMQALNFTAFDDGTNQPLTMVYTTADAAL